MACEKLNPMEEPPVAHSDDEEEEETEVEETSSGEEEEEDEDEETPEPMQLSSPPSKQPTSESEESEAESESDSGAEPTPKPRLLKQASKRANETEGTQKETKRAKKKERDGGEEAKKAVEETKKQLFQRVWSEEDEIAVLKGMIEFSTKKGIDPTQDMIGFLDFIKNSLHVDVSRIQLADKIRRLKKRYENGKKKGIFSKPHEQKSYELSKKVWGPVGIDDEKDTILKFVDVDNFLFDTRSFGVAGPGLEDYVIKNGLHVIGGLKKVELEQRWKKLQTAQLELFLERSDLVREQAYLILKALKSSHDK